MRAPILILLFCGLTACQLVRPVQTGPAVNPVTGGPVAVATLDAPEPAPSPSDLIPTTPRPIDLSAPQAQECAAKGGTWAPVRGGATCYLPTPDAGARCDRRQDCSSQCLARSRTCAPITPLIGCHAVLQTDGRESTLCID